jgi:hypothetical protein
MKEHGFTTPKHEIVHLSQWTQKHPKQHHGMQSFSHHGCNERGGSPWSLILGHRCNASNQKSNDGGLNLVLKRKKEKKKHLKAKESMG